MPKDIWGNSAISREISEYKNPVQPMGAMTTGPVVDLTPHDSYTTPIMNSAMTPSMDVMPSPYGPPYGIADSDFSKLEHRLAGEKGVSNPAALAASIGRKELGQAEMTRRSKEGRKKKKE